MELKHLTVATVAAFGLATAAIAEQYDRTGSQSSGAMHSQMDQSQVRQIQQQLQSRGYDVGPVDGIMGEQTKSALREFQQAQGMRATGTPNKETLSALGVQDASGTGQMPTGASGSGTTGSGTTGTMQNR